MLQLSSKTFANLRLKAENFDITRAIYPNHEKSGQFFKKYLFHMLLEVSQIF